MKLAYAKNTKWILFLLNKVLELVSIEHRRCYDEKNSCYYCLHADCAADICTTRFEGYKDHHRTYNGNGNGHPIGD